MFCPNCGKEMSDSAEFCSNCGFKRKKNNITKGIFVNKPLLAICTSLVVLLLLFFVKNLVSNESVSNGWNGDYYYNAKIVSEYSADTTVDKMDTITIGLDEKSEPIEWIVLKKDGNKSLLLSKYILANHKYNDKDVDITWENCTMRKWLNSVYINILFSEKEQVSILTTDVINNNNAVYGTKGGNNTKDKLFLLSIDEANKYFSNDGQRVAMNKDGSSFVWWLRSPGYNQDYAALVYDLGHLFENGNFVYCDYGVRPAMWVDISKYNVNIVDNSNKNGWNGDNYYKNGQMIKNDWVEYNGNWYYLGLDGRYVRNYWKEIKNEWYYFDENGAMKSNAWVSSNGNYYYVDSSGKMLKNAMTPDGYYVGEDGKYIDLNALSIANGKPIANKLGSGNYASELIEIYNGTYFGLKINTCKFDNEGRLWVHDEQAEIAYHINNACYAEIYKIYITKDNYTEYKLTYSDVRGGMLYENDNYYKNDTKITEAEFINIRNTFDAMQDMYDELTKNTVNIKTNTDDSLSKQIRNAKLVTEYSVDTTVDKMDTVTFGSYYQSNSSTKEPIEWIVLEKSNGKALLLSKYVLTNHSYNDECVDITWENCTMRKWLNSEYINTIFSKKEQRSILTTDVINNDNAKYGTKGGNNTKDKLFLLSIDEVNKYFSTDGQRVATYKGETGLWWLRSPGYDQNNAVLVSNYGDLSDFGDSVDYEDGVRPALWVSYE